MPEVAIHLAEPAVAELEAPRSWYARQAVPAVGDRLVREIVMRIEALHNHLQIRTRDALANSPGGLAHQHSYAGLHQYYELWCSWETAMGTVRKTITLTDTQDQWVKSQIARGDYTNDSEYFRALIRRDQDQSMKLEALRDAVREGLDSGVSDRTVGEIWAEAEARYKGRSA